MSALTVYIVVSEIKETLYHYIDSVYITKQQAEDRARKIRNCELLVPGETVTIVRRMIS